MIVVDGDPLANLSPLTQQGAHMAPIMQRGKLIKNSFLADRRNEPTNRVSRDQAS
jgi:hypothetical protein